MEIRNKVKIVSLANVNLGGGGSGSGGGGSLSEQDEFVIATALNNLNERLVELENNAEEPNE